MGRATPELYDLAGRILSKEAEGPLEGTALADVAEGVCKKLRHHLVQLIGSYATQLLIKRALTNTELEYPFLKDVDVDPDGRLNGLRERVETLGQNEGRNGLTTMLANFIGLLFDFIGEDLTMYRITTVWPGITDPESRQEGKI